jgi:hypothetical protein
LPYYDIVFESCTIDKQLEDKLGFGKIGVIPRDIGFAELDKHALGNERKVIATGPAGKLISAVNSGVPAVCIANADVEKDLIAAMSDNGTVLCVPLSEMMGLYGLKRSRLFFKMGKLFTYARKHDVEVSFVTLARSRSMMCSNMQVLELAKLVGATEDYARKSINEVNKGLVE